VVEALYLALVKEVAAVLAVSVVIDVQMTLFRFHPYMILMVRNNVVISLSVLLADLEGRLK